MPTSSAKALNSMIMVAALKRTWRAASSAKGASATSAIAAAAAAHRGGRCRWPS